MILTRTPFRISFVGGGSDMEAFYSRADGAVLSTTINKYMYVSAHKFFEPDQIRLKYSRTETVDNLRDIEHPIFKMVLEKYKVAGGLEFSSIADVPAGTGMGSSSSFTVSLLHTVRSLLNLPIDKEILAREACEIEIDLLKEPIGKQDQYAAAYGGMHVYRFLASGKVIVEEVRTQPEILESLESNLMLFYTGLQRSASGILSEQKKNISDQDKFENLRSMTALVNDLKDCLESGLIDDFGAILHENWILKQQLAGSISSDLINKAYHTALSSGALGGKLLGAGGGGFLLFYCPRHKQEKLIEALKPLRYFPFAFEKEGSKIVYLSHE